MLFEWYSERTESTCTHLLRWLLATTCTFLHDRWTCREPQSSDPVLARVSGWHTPPASQRILANLPCCIVSQEQMDAHYGTIKAKYMAPRHYKERAFMEMEGAVRQRFEPLLVSLTARTMWQS